MKTPEQLAEDYSEAIDLCCGTSDIIIQAEGAFMAGYEAGQKESHEQIKSLQKLVHECQQELKARDKTIEEMQIELNAVASEHIAMSKEMP